MHHVARLGLAACAMALAGVLLFRVIPVRSDMTVLMADNARNELSSLFHAINDGPANRFILIGIEPAATADAADKPAALSRAIRDALAASGLFERVSNGEFGHDMGALQPFFDNRYRLNPPLDADDFSVAGLKAAFDRLLQRLRGLDAPLVKTVMAADPGLRTFDVIRLWAATSAAALRHGVWMDETGRRVLLIAVTKAPGYDLDAQQANVAAVRAAVRQAEARFGPQKLILSGPPVIAIESKRIAESESQRLVILSVVLVVGFLIFAFRRVSFLPSAMVPITVGFLVGMAAVGLLFGHVHVTTLGFGATLIGVAVDYPLHLMGLSSKERPAAAAARQIAPALMLGVLTSAIGFMPLAFSSFPGVAQLGVFAVAGLLAAAAVTRWGLPALLPPPSGPAKAGGKSAHAAIAAAARPARLVACGAGLLALIYLAAPGSTVWTSNLSALSPIPENLRASDRILREDINAVNPRYLIAISGTNEEELLQRSEALRPALDAAVADGTLDGYDMAARYLPSAKRQARLLSAIPDEATLRDRVGRAMEGYPFRPGAFAPFIDDVAAAKTGGPLTVAGLKDDMLAARITGLLQTGKSGDARGLVLLHGRDAAAAGRAVLRLAARQGLADDVRFFDLKLETMQLLVEYRRETALWALVGGGLAILVLAFVLRNVRAVAGIVLPVAIAMAVAAALTAVVAGGLNLFGILGLMVVAGLGIDYAVFLGHGRPPAEDANGRPDVVRTVFICMATTFIVFSVMAMSAVPILAQIGLPVAIGAPLSFVLALVFVRPRPIRAA